MVSYIFVGRLDREKGINLLLEAFAIHQKNHPNTILHICGTGQEEKKVQEIADSNAHIIYHGWVWKETIRELIIASDYMVMPSIFLETFGLTALEALMLGTPVIGDRKWWCEAFIHPLLQIHTDDTKGAVDELCVLFDKIEAKNIEKKDLNKRMNDIQQHYTANSWSENFSLCYPYKDIILMSDYSNKKLGWIETHLDTIQTQLKVNGHRVTTWDSGGIKGKWWKIQRLWHMLRSLYNPWPWIWLQKMVKKEREATIWFHSILRHIGRYTLYRLLSYRKWKKWIQTLITYHDLGLFHPFPHRVTQIDQLPSAWSLKQRIYASQSYNPFIILSVTYKYILVCLVHTYLRQLIDIHIVPSPFMVDILQKRHPHITHIVLPHFVVMDQ